MYVICLCASVGAQRGVSTGNVSLLVYFPFTAHPLHTNLCTGQEEAFSSNTTTQCPTNAAPLKRLRRGEREF